MPLTFPDEPLLDAVTRSQLRLELACALYARRKIGKIRGAELAGVDFVTFQRALGDRHISHYTVEDLNQDIAALNQLFPSNPIPTPNA